MKHFKRLKPLVLLPLLTLLALPLTSLATTCTGEIVKIKLRNHYGDGIINLENGRIYQTGDLPAHGKLKIKVGGEHESVKITISGSANVTHIDNNTPYTYAGSGGLTFSPGDYTIKVRLFSHDDAQGELCHVKTINFTVVEGPGSAVIKRIKLHNLDGDNGIKLEDGGQYSLGELPTRFKLSVRASGFHESLRLSLSGPFSLEEIDNKTPYVFQGENGLQFTPGDYTLIAQLYNENNLDGSLLDEKRINFSIQPGPNTATIKRVKLQAIGGGSNLNLEDGETYSLAQIPSLCRIKAVADGFHESLQFNISGPVTGQHIDNKLPYFCSGEQGLEFGPGIYTINTRLFSANHAGGETCDEKSVTFTVTDNYCTGQIRKFRFKALDGTPSMDIVDGQTYTRDELPSNFKIQANVAGEAESVKFTLTGNGQHTHLDNVAPYRLNGDASLQEWAPGEYIINAKAYSHDNAHGDFCDEKEVRFIIEEPVVVEVQGGAIATGTCHNGVLTLKNVNAPVSDGNTLEIVWIKSDNNGNCNAGLEELAQVDIGAAYDAFITAGGFGSINPGVGNSSWKFLPDDGDGDDLKLVIENVQGTSCYIRLARAEGTQEFTGQTEPLFIQGGDCPSCDDPIDGGLIVIDDEDPSSGFVVIENDRAPQNPGNGIDTPETIYIKSDEDDYPTAELATVSVGQAYQEFQAAGGFGVADPSIDGTSWEFVTDGDEDPLTLIDDEVLPFACYLRCVRARGCVDFHGDSNPVVFIATQNGNLVAADEGNEAQDTRNTVADDGSEGEEHSETSTVVFEEEILLELQQRDEALKIYPNPAHGIVFFSTDKFSTTGGKLEVFNGLGQLVYQQNFEAGRNNTFQFDLETFALGLYFVRLEFADGEKLVNRFVVD